MWRHTYMTTSKNRILLENRYCPTNIPNFDFVLSNFIFYQNVGPKCPQTVPCPFAIPLQTRHFGAKWRHRFNGFLMGFLITRDGVGRLATRQRVSQRLFIVTTLLEREKRRRGKILDSVWQWVFNGFLITREGVGRLATRQRVSHCLCIVTTLFERGKDAAEKCSRRRPTRCVILYFK